MSIVKLGKLSNVEALIALFNNAKTQGLGVIHYKPLHKLSELEANSALLQSDYVDYLEGRVIKTRFPLDASEIDCTLYDRDNGEGSAEHAIREYERVHYSNRGTASLYIPESFGGSKCRIVKDIYYEKVYKFKVMDGELSIFQQGDDVFFSQTVFMFTLNSRCAKVLIGKAIEITEDIFLENARRAIREVVNELT